MKPIINALGKLNRGKRTHAALVLCAATALALPAQTFTTLLSFDSTDGAGPQGALVQGTDGNGYGTTAAGGASNHGTVFQITPTGTLTTLYSFCAQTNCTDGELPTAGLIQAASGYFYGTTSSGGAETAGCLGCGTVFRLSPSGALTTLYSFCAQAGCTDGYSPNGVVQAANGDLYGTTVYGANGSTDSEGFGTIFKITPAGALTTLYSFCPQTPCTGGKNPFSALVQATDGDFYGTTGAGGANQTIYRVTPAGKLTTLHRFCSHPAPSGECPDGSLPSGLIQAANGNLYGTTTFGGANCVTATQLGCGTVFEITPGGTFTTIYSFCAQTGCPDGAYPYAGLVQGTDGNLYGTTGGAGQYATIFRITPSGVLTTLYTFCSAGGTCTGSEPSAALVQATNGTFYGTTYRGGANFTCPQGCGTIFSLSVGLGPFVEPRPTSGKLGAKVEILGTNLTGATSVTFNGTAATFNVSPSGTYIATTVPSGATTGTVQVTTPSGTLSSNMPFRVLP